MNTQLRFACGITMYNPNERTIEHIIEYTISFDVVFVYDNSDKNNCINISALKKNPRVVYMGGTGNDGLPYAYNRILESNEILNIDFLCTLDQDSTFSSKNIAAIKNYIKFNDTTQVGIIAPYVNYSNAQFEHKDSIEEKSWTITSGSFLNLALIRENKLRYDERYFIDKFEIDLCKQVKEKDLKVVMYLGSELKQRLGEESGYRHPNHSQLRHRYLFRNRFYFNNKFYGVTKRWILNTLQTFKHLMLIIMYEENKLKKIKMFFLACNDYLNGKMGKIL